MQKTRIKSSKELIKKVKQLVLSEQESFLKRVGKDLYSSTHISSVVRLSKNLAKTHPEADKDIAVLGAWLHDGGIFSGDGSYPSIQDHAVTGEKKAKEILENLGIDKSTIEKVAHIVRSHRNHDVSPATIEAKIVAAADSAAHFFGGTYKKIVQKSKRSWLERIDDALGKLERDWRDVTVFPELAHKLKESYESNKNELLKLKKSGPQGETLSV